MNNNTVTDKDGNPIPLSEFTEYLKEFFTTSGEFKKKESFEIAVMDFGNTDNIIGKKEEEG